MPMPNYGFLIDNRKCIGCHACSTACKSENEVPLGVNRTWVKYVEKGTFPDTRRFFQVTRCNHCANPPCVHICPVKAMYQRPDGIVEFDPSLCIGCKACMQACPYDAIYIDPETKTAAKCHFCAHRTEVGLEPACAVVCPEHAIIAGDMSDPKSEISRLLATQPVHVRKPEQGTQPKVFYISAEEVSIVPNLAAQDKGMLWSDWPDHGSGDWRGPIKIGNGRMAEAMVQSAQPRETYNAPHKVPWHWQVPAYLTTKSIGAGAFAIAATGLAFGLFPKIPLFTTIAAFIALLFIGLTTVLLVWDLDRPERFWTILVRPQWKSWLARGAFILVGFSIVSGLFFLGHLLGFSNLANWLILPGVILAVASAVYTAYLFAQAEGRDLWQSTLLPWHLFVQAIMAGAAGLLMTSFLFNPGPTVVRILGWVFGTSLVVNLFVTLAGEFGLPHASHVAATAAHLITHGKYKNIYRFSLLGGLIVPLILTAVALAVLGLTSLTVFASLALLAAASILSIAGLFAYEWAFVMAPQDVPNN
jgi:Fe-S-cluster-containing dehydrogenase component/formate-dependent nitrite reductase membrane component NrfD